jgi:hypothetical protein
MKLLPDTMPEPNVEYYWKRTDGWKWFDGCEHWWEVFVVFYDGFNGGGGACIEERWRWNGSSQNLRVQPRNLSLQETRQLIVELSGKLVENNSQQGS